MAPTRPGTVLFLGAGATRPFGVPLTAEILPTLLRRLSRGTLFGRNAARTSHRTYELLRALAPGLGRRGIEPPLITDLLSIVDHMLAAGQAVRPGLGPHELDKVRWMLERGLAEVLATPGGRRQRNRGLLERFADWTLRQAEPGPLTLISTNYDVVIERSLYARLDGARFERQVDFGVGWYALGSDERHGRPARPRLRLLKLHGSLDWRRCPLCDHLYIQPAQTALDGRLRRSPRERLACACGYRPLRHVMVAPSMVRDVRDTYLLAIWRAALEALRCAERWIVIGYSMPPEDVAIRSMFVRALGGRAQPPEILLVQRRGDADVRDRYRLFAPDLTFVPGGLEELLKREGA